MFIGCGVASEWETEMNTRRSSIHKKKKRNKKIYIKGPNPSYIYSRRSFSFFFFLIKEKKKKGTWLIYTIARWDLLSQNGRLLLLLPTQQRNRKNIYRRRRWKNTDESLYDSLYIFSPIGTVRLVYWPSHRPLWTHSKTQKNISNLVSLSLSLAFWAQQQQQQQSAQLCIYISCRSIWFFLLFFWLPYFFFWFDRNGTFFLFLSGADNAMRTEWLRFILSVTYIYTPHPIGLACCTYKR